MTLGDRDPAAILAPGDTARLPRADRQATSEIATDLRSLLAAIVGNVQLARLDPDGARSISLDAIEEAALRAIALVGRLLAVPEVRAAPVTPVASEGTILVVEDDASVCRTIEDILTGIGYTVLVAGDGVAAVRLLTAHGGPINLVLTDVIMPDMGGPELARRVAETRPGTPILLMSGSPDNIRAGGWVLAPDVPFIEKPFTMDALIAMVREMLDGGSRPTPPLIRLTRTG